MTLIVRSLAVTYRDRFHIEPHVHAWGQLVYAAAGVMRVKSEATLWLVPPAQAVWVPAGSPHEIWARGEVVMRTVYVEPRFARVLPQQCQALEVSPLLRALVLRVVQAGMLDSQLALQRRLALVMIDEIATTRVLPLSLPLPKDSRACRVADALREEPGLRLELAEFAQRAGASARTLQRLFVDETGLRFSEWRQRLRLIHAAGLIGNGSSVTNAAAEAGYDSTSAFIAAFRAKFGHTPSQMKMEE